MAMMQVYARWWLAQVARQVRDIIATLQQDVRPLIARANAIADEAVEDRVPRDGAGAEDRSAGHRADPAG